MPIPSNYLEELVAEWLALDGFFVEANLPGPPGRGGGRLSPDVVGVRIGGKEACIRHCEVTAYISSPADARRYGGKFSESVVRHVRREFATRLGLEPIATVPYQKWVIYGNKRSKTLEARLHELLPDVTAMSVKEFIAERVVPDIRKWKKRHLSERGNEPTLPQDKWLLQFLDYLLSTGMIPALPRTDGV